MISPFVIVPTPRTADLFWVRTYKIDWDVDYSYYWQVKTCHGVTYASNTPIMHSLDEATRNLWKWLDEYQY